MPFVVDAEVVLEVADQLAAGEVDLGKMLRVALPAGQEPACIDPRFQHLRLEPGVHEEFAAVHVTPPLSARAAHWAMNFSSSASGFSGRTTLSVTYSSPFVPSERGAPRPFRRSTLPVLVHLGTVMVTAPEGVGHIQLAAEHGRRERDRQLDVDVVVLAGEERDGG